MRGRRRGRRARGRRGRPAGPARRSRRCAATCRRRRPPDLDRHAAELDLDEVWEYLNPQMLYGKHLGLKGSVRQLEAEGDPKLAKLEAVIEELKELARGGAMRARAVWRFFPAEARGRPDRAPRSGDAASPPPPGTSRARRGRAGSASPTTCCRATTWRSS